MKTLRRLLPYLAFVLIAGAGTALWLNRDYAQDWWQLRGYTPPANIEQLAESTDMTEHGQRLFYVNKPTLDDKQTFNRNCAGIIEEAAVLGCYSGNRGGIHIYHVTDERLEGIEEVTAAHEMLHQAYDRLNASERERIDGLLWDFYQNGLSDQSVRDKLALYDQNDRSELVNEMHSIFGTEVAELSAELEQYYGQYFGDRQQVIAFRKQSRAAFQEYRNQIDEYDDRLASLQSQIGGNEAALSDRLDELERARVQLDADLQAGRVEQYNSAVPGFNAQVETYNSLLADTRALVNEYNQLVEERNAVAVQVTDLNAALDSRLKPQ